MDVETRELRYFVAVAEELHFGRAARRLGIAQPPLSRAIRLLERRLGVTLLERTSREVRLTAAGEVLLAEGRGALGTVAAAVRRTQRAAATTPRLVLALKPGADADHLLQLILLGRMVAVLPESVRDRLPPGTVSRPVADAEPATLVIAWPQASTSRQIAAFVRAAISAASPQPAFRFSR